MMWQGLTLAPELMAGAQILGLVIAVILHEVAHGYTALRLGDPTAYYAGRLTLNPIKHIDMWGTILIPGFLILSGSGFVFGWAKPVPVNYGSLRGGRWGPLMVALAGPATNFILLAFFGLLVRLSPAGTALPYLFSTIAIVNGVLMLFNLIPIPPLDGSKILYVFLDQRPEVVQWLEQYGLYIMIFVLLFGQGLLSTFVFLPAVVLARFFAGPLLF